MSNDTIVGIAFNEYCWIARWDKRGPQLYFTLEGKPYLPCMVAVKPDTKKESLTVITGKEVPAKETGWVIFKKIDKNLDIYHNKTVGTFLLGSILKKWQEIIKDTLNKAVIAIPYPTSIYAREIMKNALQKRGIECLDFLESPFAILLGYATENKGILKDSQKILVIEKGRAGLFWALLTVQKSTISLKQTGIIKKASGWHLPQNIDKVIVCGEEIVKEVSAHIQCIETASWDIPAKGAAYWAAVLTKKARPLKLQKPFKLGIEINKDRFLEMIPSNIPLPYEGKRAFKANNNKVLIKVLAGVSPQANACIPLHSVPLEIPPDGIFIVTMRQENKNEGTIYIQDTEEEIINKPINFILPL